LSALRDIGIHLNPHHASELASPAGLRDALGAGIGTPLKVRNAILEMGCSHHLVVLTGVLNLLEVLAVLYAMKGISFWLVSI
jgi:hypothetical protein